MVIVDPNTQSENDSKYQDFISHLSWLQVNKTLNVSEKDEFKYWQWKAIVEYLNSNPAINNNKVRKQNQKAIF